MKDDLKKMKTLLDLGMIREFNNLAIRQPIMFSGAFNSKDEAETKLLRLVKNRSPGQLFYVEQKDTGWFIMSRLTTRVWKEWWEELGWDGPHSPPP